jgi:hypothetical protein
MSFEEKLKITEQISQLHQSIENRKRLLKESNRTEKSILHHKNMIEHEQKIIKVLNNKLSKMEK